MSTNNNDIAIDVYFNVDKQSYSTLSKVINDVSEKLTKFEQNPAQLPPSLRSILSSGNNFDVAQTGLQRMRMLQNFSQETMEGGSFGKILQKLTEADRPEQMAGNGSGQSSAQTAASINQSIQAMAAQNEYLEEIADNTKNMLSQLLKSGEGIGQRNVFGNNIENQERGLNVQSQLIGQFTNLGFNLEGGIAGQQISNMIKDTFRDFQGYLKDATQRTVRSLEKFGESTDNLNKSISNLKSASEKLESFAVQNQSGAGGNLDLSGSAMEKLASLQLKSMETTSEKIARSGYDKIMEQINAIQIKGEGTQAEAARNKLTDLANNIGGTINRALESMRMGENGFSNPSELTTIKEMSKRYEEIRKTLEGFNVESVSNRDAQSMLRKMGDLIGYGERNLATTVGKGEWSAQGRSTLETMLESMRSQFLPENLGSTSEIRSQADELARFEKMQNRTIKTEVTGSVDISNSGTFVDSLRNAIMQAVADGMREWAGDPHNMGVQH